MIVTLAGHVDHGKTTLVHALTDVNTDRLAEEKRRGLTIDLGFAYRDKLGFVDVPGHHKFIHNMIAGVAQHQFALMVIAADDGPMPQTLEHLQILELLGITRGIVALTKVDKVSAEQRENSLLRTQQLMKGTFLEAASVISCSSIAGMGIPELQEALSLASDKPIEKPQGGFRLAIDRRFNIKGAGLIVTGTVQAGEVNVDQEILLTGADKLVRVRGIHANQQHSDTASTGDRAAINISGADHSEVDRGDWLVNPSLYSPTNQIVINFKAVASARKIKHWTPIHVYSGTSHRLARLATLENTEILPGDEALVELILEDPIDCKFGDRLIIRDQALHTTLGGGPVIYQDEFHSSRRHKKRLAKIKCHLTATPESALAQRLILEPVQLENFQKLMNLTDNELLQLSPVNDAVIVENTAVNNNTWQDWKKEIQASLLETHTTHPTLDGLKTNALQALISAPVVFLNELLAELRNSQAITESNGFWRLASHKSGLSPESEKLLEKLQSPLAAPKPETVGDIAKSINIPVPQLIKGLKTLERAGLVVQISDNRFFLKDHIEQMKELTKTLASFSVADFRNQSNLGRNAAIQLLEHFDRLGLTRRKDNTRTYIGN